MAPSGAGEHAGVPRTRRTSLVAARLPVLATPRLRPNRPRGQHRAHDSLSVIYVARQLGHDARLTLTRYGHVIDELDDQPRIDAESAIQAARVPSRFPANNDVEAAPETTKPASRPTERGAG